MKVNRSRLMDVFVSDIPGAVIITADSFADGSLFAVPGVTGVKTYIGCVEFGPGGFSDTFSDIMYNDFDEVEGVMRLGFEKCKAIFNDVPIPGTAWLVIPREKDYVWERIDHLLRFQNEAEHIAENTSSQDEDSKAVADKEIDDMYERRSNLSVGERGVY
jgi:hypothetical protein